MKTGHLRTAKTPPQAFFQPDGKRAVWGIHREFRQWEEQVQKQKMWK